MKSSYRFELVRRKSDRFGWRVVAIDDAGRRVLGRSERSYGSREKVYKAIDALREACVDDTIGPPDGYPLPATKFEVVPGVLPLIVAERPVEYSLTARRRALAEEDEAPEPPEEYEGTTEPEESAAKAPAKGRLGRRTKKTE